LETVVLIHFQCDTFDWTKCSVTTQLCSLLFRQKRKYSAPIIRSARGNSWRSSEFRI